MIGSRSQHMRNYMAHGDNCEKVPHEPAHRLIDGGGHVVLSQADFDVMCAALESCYSSYAEVYFNAGKVERALEVVKRVKNQGPSAWLYTGREKDTNRQVEWASVSDNDHWPDDKWASMSISPLFCKKEQT